mmetsp:Transcript_9851/g.23105  ORF Transcript_9851/g.23105 Transcript_9851/m.23105 type:complete len:103 (-) Transcript_9851:58-366(-)
MYATPLTFKLSPSSRIFNPARTCGKQERDGQLGETPLHIAATYNKIEVLKAFLAVGADVSARNTDGKTPLDSAKQEGHSDIIALLQQESEPLTKCAQGSASQ